MRAYTSKCKEHGHLEVSVLCDETSALSSKLKWLLEWIESEVARGRRFLPEQTVQIGWSVLEIRQRNDGTLALFEPDFQSIPVKFIDSVSNTLLHLLLQKGVTDSLDLETDIAIPSLRDSAIVCTRFGSTDGFVMSRLMPQAGDSGWFFGCDSPAHDHQAPENLRRVSLYEAAVRHNDGIIPYLGLPPNTFAGFSGEVPYFSRDERELAIRRGSYLDKKYGFQS